MTSTIYQTVSFDPPWLERGSGQSKRGADRHYPLLTTPEIIATINRAEPYQRVAHVAHGYMWTTNTFLPDALRVLDALGWRYVTNVAWVKASIGLGQYFRGQHELLLFATRGVGHTSVRTDRKDLPSVITTSARRRKHSAKPPEARALIEARSYGPYLEMFAREPAPGWDAWGNEIEGFEDPEPLACAKCGGSSSTPTCSACAVFG